MGMTGFLVLFGAGLMFAAVLIAVTTLWTSLLADKGPGYTDFEVELEDEYIDFLKRECPLVMDLAVGVDDEMLVRVTYDEDEDVFRMEMV